jgi:hypothetical protein
VAFWTDIRLADEVVCVPPRYRPVVAALRGSSPGTEGCGKGVNDLAEAIVHHLLRRANGRHERGVTSAHISLAGEADLQLAWTARLRDAISDGRVARFHCPSDNHLLPDVQCALSTALYGRECHLEEVRLWHIYPDVVLADMGTRVDPELLSDLCENVVCNGRCISTRILDRLLRDPDPADRFFTRACYRALVTWVARGWSSRSDGPLPLDAHLCEVRNCLTNR